MKEYTKEEYEEFIDAYIYILKNNFNLFIDSKLTTFKLAALHDFFSSYKIYDDDNDILYGRKDTKSIFGYKTRAKVLRILEGRTTNYGLYNKSIRVIGSLYIPLIMLFTVFIFSIFRKKLFYFLTSGMLLGHTFILFITAPASYFMYYFNVYLVGWFLGILFIVKNIERMIKKKNSLRSEKMSNIHIKEKSINEKIMVFIPMYNCEKQIVRVLKQFDKKVLKYIDEIVLINNRSSDNTESVAIENIKKKKTSVKITVLRNDDNYNLGGSHKVAFDYALKNKYDYAIILHGDDQGNIKDILPMLEKRIYRNYDCILGSRFMKGSKLGGYSKFRTFGNRVYNIFFTVMLQKKISDLGSGLNMYNTKMLKDKFYYKFPDRLTFNCYMLLAVNYYKHNIKFFPITWREDDQVSNVKMFSQAMTTLGLVFKYVFNKEKYIKSDLREKKIKKYTAKTIYINKEEV